MSFSSGFILGVVINQMLIFVLFAVIFFRKALQVPQNRYLGYFFVIAAISSLLFILPYTSEALRTAHPWIFFIPAFFDMLILPPAYLYVRSIYAVMETEQHPLRPQHFIPFVINLVLATPIMMSAHEVQNNLIKYMFEMNDTTELPASYFTYELLLYGIFIVAIAQALTYFYLCIKHYKAYKKSIADMFSNTETLRLQWLTGIIVFFLFYVLIEGVFYALYSFFFGIYEFETHAYAHLILTTVLYLYVALQSMSHPILFSDAQLAEAKEYKSPCSETNGLKGQPLDLDEAKAVAARLEQLVAEEKIHLDPELTISQLTNALDMKTSGKLSRIFNEYLEESFYSYINRFRIEEAKKVLSTLPKKPIVEVAFDSGFNSVSAFYKRFKSVTGKTPADYRAEIN